MEAFRDGVLAIAITLLVLDLHTGHHVGEVAQELLAHWPTYLAYIASFVYIGVVWLNHHVLFARIAHVDNGLLWSNLGVLLTASVLPFPSTELAFAMGSGTHQDPVSALLLYALVSAVTGMSWLVVFTYLHHHPQLLEKGVPATFFDEERRRAMVGVFAPVLPSIAPPPRGLGLWCRQTVAVEHRRAAVLQLW